MPYPIYDPKDFQAESQGYTFEDYAVTISILAFFVIVYFLLPYLKSIKSKFDFIEEFLRLSAFILRTDGKVSSKEKRFVDLFIEKEFGIQKKEYHLDLLDKYLKQFDFNINEILNRINQEELKEVKIHLLHFLVKIAIVDGYLKNLELLGLQKVCKGIGLSPVRLTSMLAMYSYITEAEHQHQKRKKRSTENRESSKLKTAYMILELTDSATNTEIKKSYRKLVTLYHPDKTMHLDKYLQKGAKEMYQKVNDAYDYLKKKKSIK